jgi:hypothetical protein
VIHVEQNCFVINIFTLIYILFGTFNFSITHNVFIHYAYDSVLSLYNVNHMEKEPFKLGICGHFLRLYHHIREMYTA